MVHRHPSRRANPGFQPIDTGGHSPRSTGGATRSYTGPGPLTVLPGETGVASNNH